MGRSRGVHTARASTTAQRGKAFGTTNVVKSKGTNGASVSGSWAGVSESEARVVWRGVAYAVRNNVNVDARVRELLAIERDTPAALLGVKVAKEKEVALAQHVRHVWHNQCALTESARHLCGRSARRVP